MNKSSGLSYTITFIVGIIIGLAVGYYLFGIVLVDDTKLEVITEKSQDITDEDGYPVLPAGESMVEVANQNAGDRVVIISHTLDRTGWIVVREDVDGNIGNILGARLSDSGGFVGGEVKLLRNTEPGKVYYVLLYADDGNRAFDIATDLPMTDEQGELIVKTFTTNEAEE